MSALQQAILSYGTAGGGPTITPITWNPSDKNALLSLDEADKRAYSTTSGTWRGVRSATSFTTGGVGDLMIEVERLASANVIVGFMKSTGSLADSAFVGSDANGWGYYASNGNKFNNGTGSAYGASLAAGDKFRAKINAAGDIEFFKNGVSQGVAFTGLSGTFYPAVSVFDFAAGSGARAT